MTAQRSVNRMLAVALAPFVLAMGVGLWLLWPAHQHHRTVRSLGAPARLVDGTVDNVQTGTCSAGEGRCSTVYVRITSGPDRGHPAILSDVALGPGVPELHSGDHIRL